MCFSLVRSRLEYANLIWHNDSIIQNLSQTRNNFYVFNVSCINDCVIELLVQITKLFYFLRLNPEQKIWTVKFKISLRSIKQFYRLYSELIERLNFKIDSHESRHKLFFYPSNNISTKRILLFFLTIMFQCLIWYFISSFFLKKIFHRVFVNAYYFRILFHYIRNYVHAPWFIFLFKIFMKVSYIFKM